MHLISLIPIACAASFVLYRVLEYVYNILFSPHRVIPGPPLARFTKLYYFYHVYLGRFEHLNIALHRRYRSPIVRIAPNWYSLSDQSAMKTVYGLGSKFAKADWYEGWKAPGVDRYTLFTGRSIQQHSQDRKKVAAMYSMSAMVHYEPYVNDCTAVFAERLREIAESGAFVDMTHWFQCYAFDVIGMITYSKRFGFMDRGEDVGGILAKLEKNLLFSSLSGIYSGLHPYIYPIGKVLGGGAAAQTFLYNFGMDMWKKREEEGGFKGVEDPDKDLGTDEGEAQKPTDMLAKFVHDLEAGKPGWQRRDVASASVANIVAGSDTTAVSLSSVLYHLLKYPKTLEKLRAEIEDFERRGECGKVNVTFKESQAMPYLQAVIKEALRLHPATGLPLWREVPQGGAEICGHWFKGGEVVGVNSWVFHYNTELFGEDAAEFKPERWLEEDDEEKLKVMEKSWMPFGAGARTCIGKNISMLEMCKMLPYILREFDFELEHPDTPWKTVNYWFVKQVNFNVKISRRNVQIQDKA